MLNICHTKIITERIILYFAQNLFFHDYERDTDAASNCGIMTEVNY